METVQKKEIKQEELSAVVENQNAQKSVLLNMGTLEFQKSVLTGQLNELVKQSEELKKGLEEAYGQVTIDLKTGEYKEVEPVEESVE
jgi:hypothetical protein